MDFRVLLLATAAAGFFERGPLRGEPVAWTRWQDLGAVG